jgi:hypothetical protein
VAAFDNQGLIFAVGVNSQFINLYDVRNFEHVGDLCLGLWRGFSFYGLSPSYVWRCRATMFGPRSKDGLLNLSISITPRGPSRHSTPFRKRRLQIGRVGCEKAMRGGTRGDTFDASAGWSPQSASPG